MEDTSSKPRNLGGSLPVPNVQDLAADEITPELLERYLRGADAPAAAVKASLVVVPVVDLGRLVDPAHAEEEAGRLRAACEEWGFFQVVNHGVPEKIIGEVKEDVEAFFRLPLAEKQAVAQGPGGIEGYVLTNGRYKSIEHRAVVSARHHRVSLAAFHSAKFDATYAPLLAGEPPRYRTIAAEDYVVSNPGTALNTDGE
ncbi:hypothetical protein HU200_030220 [Digitaria exilis]|uniref:Non-haem dioxygenase N-terminal domain-containing protein n=1 Tax=Digitaria exilis TaxID=1010633 RepID=A0A835BPZ7_9POAL|nr:hypothetical protein HU200_030220 [Digitaria exilis]